MIEYKNFGDYWDTRIDYYKKNYPVTFENTFSINMLYREAYNMWKVLHPELYKEESI